MSRENFSISGSHTSGFNYQMCILSVLAICMVVFGHIKNDMTSVGTFNGWFPYYSLHLPIFLFISGYFFKDIDEKNCLRSFGSFLWKKIRSILIPYYVINGIFLALNSVLINWGFTYVRTFSLQEWLIHPWTRLYTISFASPSWYLMGFFIAEIYFAVIRKLFSLICRKELVREVIMLILFLAAGMVIIYLNNRMQFSQPAKVYLRSAVMLFFLQLGVIYKKYLEKIDRIPGVWYFLIVFALQFLLIICLGNDKMNPQLYELTGFDTAGCNFFLAGITGIALWLRISRMLASIPGRSRFIMFVGNNTKYIMSFHIVGFFLLNYLFDWLQKKHILNIFLDGFSEKGFKTYLYYSYIENPRVILLYFAAGMLVSLLLAKGISLVRAAIKNKMIVKTDAG